MNILVTGGAGYTGSHTIIELHKAGHSVVVVDNLVNSSAESLSRVGQIIGRPVPFYHLDLRDRASLDAVFQENSIDCVIHFAGLKAVGESVVQPLEYYYNNLAGTLVLLDVMKAHGVKNLIFSSSATVYGDAKVVPVSEETPRQPAANPYGKSKTIIEDMLMDMARADQLVGEENLWHIVLLRYFNPIGAHPSGLIGEDPNGIPNNLVPYITQVAVGRRPHLTVYGNDYDTPDGTGVRDYIHVVDLARGHVHALKAIERHAGVSVYNLGTGIGYSVLDVVHAFEKASGINIPYVIGPRRPGDIAAIYSDPGKAFRELGWKAELTLEDMCRDSWNWQQKNPEGYQK